MNGDQDVKLWKCPEDETELWGAEAYDQHKEAYPDHEPELVAEGVSRPAAPAPKVP